jgi:Uma2 family endonuclease
MIERTRITAAEYLALPETTQPMELLNAIVIVSPSPTPRHQRITGNVHALLRSHARTNGGRAYIAPLSRASTGQARPSPSMIAGRLNRSGAESIDSCSFL